MSLQELQDEVARLSPEDRATLRAHLDPLDVFSNPTVMEAWTRQNREAAAGAVVSHEEAIGRLKAAGKQLDRVFPEAEGIVVEDAHTHLPKQERTRFLAKLDEAPKDLPELRRLLRKPSIFVKS